MPIRLSVPAEIAVLTLRRAETEQEAAAADPAEIPMPDSLLRA
jgi:hypothetical protein